MSQNGERFAIDLKFAQIQTKLLFLLLRMYPFNLVYRGCLSSHREKNTADTLGYACFSVYCMS